jgi:uncharacterized YkwD family protein
MDKERSHMKGKKQGLLVFVILIGLSLSLFVGCKKEYVKGVESSVSEEGEIKNVKVTTDEINVRSGCSSETDILNTSNKDETLNVVGKVEDWYAVKLEDNTIGFVAENECKPIVVEGNQETTGSSETSDGTQPISQGTDESNKDTGIDADSNDEINKADLTDAELIMLNLINEERASNGLNPLEISMELTKVARIKSQDMIDNNYFSHYSPTYGDPFNMMKNYGIQYVKAAENIAGNQTVEGAHDALMNSPGHRENILTPEFTHVGIGIMDGGQYGKMFTQMFISKGE